MGLAPVKRLRVNRRTYWVGLAIACGLDLAAKYLLRGVYENAFSTWVNITNASWVLFLAIVTALCWGRLADAGAKRSIALAIPISMAVSAVFFSSLHAFSFDKDGWPFGFATLFYSTPNLNDPNLSDPNTPSPLGILVAAAPLVLTVLVAIIAGCLKHKQQSGAIAPEKQLSNRRMHRVGIGALSLLAIILIFLFLSPYVIVVLFAGRPNEWKIPYKTTSLGTIYRKIGHPRDCGTADEEVCWRKNHWWRFQELDILCKDCNNPSLLPDSVDYEVFVYPIGYEHGNPRPALDQTLVPLRK